MKAIKYLMIGAVMIGFSAPAMAQEDHKAVIEQVSKIIKAKGPDMADQVKSIFKENKKNADVLTAIGRAYLDIKDTENAEKYANMAVLRDKNYGNAYVLLGDIAVVKDDGGTASGWFEQATHFDPKNPEGYRRYAQVNSKVSPSSAVAKLEELRRERPDYPVDIISAEIYDKAGNLDKAIEYYEKVDKAKMEDYQLAAYAVDHFLKGEFDKSLAVSQYGNQKFPTHAGLNRVTFFNFTNKKNYPEALKYADILFNKSENAKLTESDYLYYGYAYLGNKEYDNAIAMFRKCIENNTDKPEDTSDALKNISTAYLEKGDMASATSTYDEYLKSLKEITAYDLGTLAGMYQKNAENLSGDAKKAELDKADAVWAQIAEKFPSVAVVATYNRAHIAFSLDPDTKDGLAKPHYEKMVELLTAKANRDEKDNNYLVESYRYLGYYYMLKDDNNTAKTYWQKVLDIDPNNETAKKAMGI